MSEAKDSWWRNIAKIALILCAGLILPACYTTKLDKNKSEEVARGLDNRSLEDRVKKWDLTKRSSFENGDKGSRDNRYFKQSGVKRKEYMGNTEYRGKKNDFYSGKDGYRTKEFSRADQKNRMQQEGFREAGQKSQFAEDGYKTGESRFNQKALREGEQTSRMEGQSYRVPVDHETRNALEKSKKPLILDVEEPGYTEGEIGSFLNRN